MAHQDAESAKNEVEMESCSESMAPGAWAGSTAANVNEKFKNDGNFCKISAFLNHFSAPK